MNQGYDQNRGYPQQPNHQGQGGYQPPQGSAPTPYGSGQAPYPPPGQYRMLNPHRGGMILAFGLCSWMVCFIFGIFAWTMAKHDLAELKAGRMDPTGEGLTTAGYWLGMISVVMTLVAVPIVVIAWIMLFASVGSY